MNFTSHGYHYLRDEFGIHQLNPEQYVYDSKYCATYNTEKYRHGNEVLQALRLGFVIGCHGSVPNSIADIGFGNGAFLQRCRGIIPKLYGKDVSDVQLDFIERVWSYPKCDVITFWDCLEHIQDLSFLHDLPCETVCISLPWCHFDSVEWFDSWKHRKPNEHVHHFDSITLEKTMWLHGWGKVAISHHEDLVRVPENGQHNILSMGFKRK